MTPSFSQRHGINPLKKEIQLDDMDDDLKNTLWNVVDTFYFSVGTTKGWLSDHRYYNELLVGIWINFLKDTADSIRDLMVGTVIGRLRTKYFLYDWNEVYDFIEYQCFIFPKHSSIKFKTFLLIHA